MAPLEETRPTGHGRARGLLSSRESGRRVDARTFAPPPDLAPLIESLWVGRWDLPDESPHVTRLLGDPAVHVCLGTPQAGHPAARLVGVWTRRWDNRLEGRGVVRAAKLRPGAAGALVPSAAALRDRIVPLTACFDGVPDPDRWPWEEAADAAAFEALVAFLRPRLASTDESSLAVRACQLVQTDGELLQAGQLADAVGLSLRQLQRLFRTHVGATPKFVIRRQRLQEAAVRIERGDGASLTTLAHELGYADQAHFSRDFRAATGLSASAFARRVGG